MPKNFNVPMLQGLIKDYHSRSIPDNKCSEAMNVIFKGGQVKNRWGYASLGNQVNGAVMGIAFYERFRTESTDIVLFTSTDTYKYNQQSGKWDFITYSYNTGTVTNNVGDGTVTITTGSFASFINNSIMYIKFGTTDINGPGDWYPVEYSSATELSYTGTGSLPVASGSMFVLRICWQGDETDYHSFAFPYYDDGSMWTDNILLVSNGVDIPQWWDGSGCMKLAARNFENVEATMDGTTAVLTNMESNIVRNINAGDTVTGTGIPSNTIVINKLSTTSITLSNNTTVSGTKTDLVFAGAYNPAKHIGFFGSVGYEHTILANVYDGGNNAQTLEYSDAGNPFKFTGNYDDLVESNDEIVGIVPLETRIVVYKKHNISMMTPNQGGTPYFLVDENIKRGIGTTSIRTVKSRDNYHIFMGWDNIYTFDGINVDPIGSDVIQYMIGQMNRDAMINSFAVDLTEESLYCLFVPCGDRQETPNYCFCFNYAEKHWTMWSLTDSMTSFGFFVKNYSPAYANWITFATGDLVSGSYSIAITDADELGLQVGMSVFRYTYGSPRTYISGLPVPGDVAIAKITSIAANSIVVSVAASADVTGASLKIGWAYEDVNQRYKDLIVKANYNTYILGDRNGFVYEFSPDLYNDDDTTIPANFVTSDFDMGDPKNNKRLTELVIGYATQSGGGMRVRASVDFGSTWSEWITFTIDGTGADVSSSTFSEFICNFILRGTQCRFEFSNYYANAYTAPFVLENFTIGYFDAGDKR